MKYVQVIPYVPCVRSYLVLSEDLMTPYIFQSSITTPTKSLGTQRFYVRNLTKSRTEI